MEKEKELKTIRMMIGLYCHKKHHSKKGQLCPECAALMDYVTLRRERCPFGDNKTFCSNCKVHCYKKDMREKIRAVMRFSGPWMLLYHPKVALSHISETMREKRKLKRQSNTENSKKDS